jgi:hypothetical protein
MQASRTRNDNSLQKVDDSEQTALVTVATFHEMPAYCDVMKKKHKNTNMAEFLWMLFTFCALVTVSFAGKWRLLLKHCGKYIRIARTFFEIDLQLCTT